MGNALSIAFTGFGLMAGLIMAIGAQNVLVLRQGLLRRHVTLIVGLTIVIDAAMISAGALGFGEWVSSHPTLFRVVAVAGAVYLASYGVLAIRRAITPRSMDVQDGSSISRSEAVSAVLGASLLNPHAYLDTIVLLGGYAASYAPQERAWFAAGAIAASSLWFLALGFGSRFLTPLFQRPRSWQILDACIAALMFYLAFGLFVMALQ